MKRAALAVLFAGLPTVASAADALIQRPNGGYERQVLPNTRRGERLGVSPVPGTNSSAIYDGRGRRAGTIESKPYGGAVFYDNRGRRR